MFSKGEAIASLGLVKKSLFVFGLIVFAYSFVTFLNREKVFRQRLPQISVEASESMYLEKKRQSDYAVFVREISGKNIFTAAYSENTSSSDARELERMIENLLLVGILAGTPSKAIVEDRAGQKTFYLREGESFLRHIEVEKIGKDSVILNFRGKVFELYL